MIRETITIGLLMFASSAFAQEVCPCTETYYHVENLGDFNTKRAIFDGYLKLTYPSGLYCADGPAHQILFGPSGHCNQPVPYDFAQNVRTRECQANAVAPDVDGFRPTSDALSGNPDAPTAAENPLDRDTPQRRIVPKAADRVEVVQNGVPFTHRLIGGVWLPDRGENRLAKLADGWSLRIANGSEEFYDERGVLAKSVAANGRVTLFEFGPLGLEVRRIENAGTPEQRIVSTEWHATYRLPSRIAEPQAITIYAYGEPDNLDVTLRGRLLRIDTQKTEDLTGEIGFDAPKVGYPTVQTTFAYDAAGRVVKMIDIPRTNMTDFDYDKDPETVEVKILSMLSPAASSRYLLPKRPRPPTDYSRFGMCGSGGSELIVLDGVAGPLKISFIEACTAHDACYGRCGADKDECDREIETKIAEQCTADKFPPVVAGQQNFYLEACKRWAKGYRIAVDLFGGGAYRAAQKNCEPGRCVKP